MEDDNRKELEKLVLLLTALYQTSSNSYIKLIVDNLTITDPENMKNIDMTAMLNRVDSLTNNLKSNLQSKVNSAISNAFNLGVKNAGGTVFDGQQSVIEQLQKDTYNDLLSATNYMNEASKKFIRMKVSEAFQIQSALRLGNYNLVKTLMYKFSEARLNKDAYRNFTGIVDKAGRKWNLQTYTEMVARTKLTEAHIKGTVETGHKMGYNLFIISSHNAIDACKNWEGEIITYGGEPIDGYLDYDDLAGSGEIWHPNCKHYLTPISDVAAGSHLQRRGFRTTLKK